MPLGAVLGSTKRLDVEVEAKSLDIRRYPIVLGTIPTSAQKLRYNGDVARVCGSALKPIWEKISNCAIKDALGLKLIYNKTSVF